MATGRLQTSPAGAASETVLLRAAADLSRDGSDSETWLVATGKRVFAGPPEAFGPFGRNSLAATEGSNDLEALSPGNLESLSASDDLLFWPVEKIEKVRTWAGTGCGELQFRVDGVWQSVLRFSNAGADTFHHVSRALERIRKQDPPVVSEIVLEPPRECPECHLRLESHQENCPRCLHRSRVATRVWELIRPQLRGTVLLCVLTLIGVAAELVPPRLQQYMVDHILVDHQNSPEKGQFVTALLVVVLALAVSRVVLSLVAWFKGRLATRIGSALTWNLRGRMVQRLQQLAVAYYDRHQVGGLMSRVAYDSEVLNGLLHQLTGGFLLQILQLFGVGAMLLWLNPKLAFFTLIPVPLVVFGTVFFWKYVYPRYYRLWDSSSRQIAALSGMLSGIRVVKAFAQEDREFERYNRASTYVRDSRLWVDNATSAYSATMQVVFSLGGLIVWFIGGRDVIFKGMSLGELIAFLAYLAMFYAPLATLSNFTTWLTSFLTGSKRVLELLDTPVTIDESNDAQPMQDVKGEIRFENVTFGYEAHQPVIHNVSFRVAPGEMIGIVGRSGSGKTTMINLLGRFHDVQEGRILIDGVDIRKITMQSLRQSVGIVFQDSFLFRGTIFDNLTYGRSECTVREALGAARAAGAHDFICRNALAYETALGEGGAGLSGGEKQRLSIARTLLYDPKILVLDEATSNIDAEAEKTIQQALEVLVRGRTTIAIAHRLSTLRNADRIIVFDRGRLIEEGTHAELLDLDGTYARLVRLQTQISKNPDIDKLASLAAERPKADIAESDDAANDDSSISASGLHPLHPADKQAETPDQFVNWLTPDGCRLEEDERGGLIAIVSGSGDGDQDGPAARRHKGVFATSCFPATRPFEFISLRHWTGKDDDQELGIIESPGEWPAEQQELIRKSLARHYCLPRISRLHGLTLAGGYLDFDVTTEMGREQFTVHWSQSRAVQFGPNGKMLIDTRDRRFVIEDPLNLPARERTLFQRYVYW